MRERNEREGKRTLLMRMSIGGVSLTVVSTIFAICAVARRSQTYV